MSNKLSKVEAEINKLERELKKTDAELATNYDALMAKPDFFEMYTKKKKRLDHLMQEWEEVQEKLEQHQ